MDILICLLCGYLIGSVNPAAMLANRKQVDLRKEGTHNLGASNTLLVMGKKYGILVMVLDILKAFLIYRVMQRLFPRLYIAGLLSGSAAVVGHVFPFHLGFRGGKGLAAFAGLVLAHDPAVFLFLLILGLTLMLLANYSFVMPLSASALFPLLSGIRSQDLWITLLCLAVSALVFVKHWGNMGRALRGEDIRIREYIKQNLFSGRHP